MHRRHRVPLGLDATNGSTPFAGRSGCLDPEPFVKNDTHPTSELEAYALGILDPREESRVRAHLAECRCCAAQVTREEDALSRMANALPMSEPSAGLWSRIASRVDGLGRLAGFASRVAALADVSGEQAAGWLDDLGDPGVWQEGPSPQIQLYHLEGGARVHNAIVGFVKMEPGAPFPMHTHAGSESVLVVQGALEDDDGRVYHAGDLAEAPPGSSHAFKAKAGETLLYLVVIEQGVQIGEQWIRPGDPRM
jgi:putative transcriptional regulator